MRPEGYSDEIERQSTGLFNRHHCHSGEKPAEERATQPVGEGECDQFREVSDGIHETTLGFAKAKHP